MTAIKNSRKTKFYTLTIIIILLLSSFIILNNINKVNAAYGTEQTNQTFNGAETNQGNFIFDGTYNIICSDNYVFVYDDLTGLLLNSFNLTSHITFLTHDKLETTKIIECNTTHILICADVKEIYSTSNYIKMKIFLYNPSDGSYQSYANLTSGILSSIQDYGTDKLMLVKDKSNTIYCLVSMTSDYVGYTTGTYVFRITSTSAYLGKNINNFGSIGFGSYFVGFGGLWIKNEITSGHVYIITRFNLTSFCVFNANLETMTFTKIYDWNEDTFSSIADKSYYGYLINNAYGTLTGNYTLTFTTTLTNATYNNLLVFHFLVFDGGTFHSVLSTYIDFSGALTPIRPIANYPQSGIKESFTGIMSLVCTDGNGNFRNLDISIYPTGYQIMYGITNYGIAQISCTQSITGTTCGWTYINYPIFYTQATNNIGGCQIFGSNLMFMIDYQNNKFNTQNGKLSIQGIATKLAVSPMDDAIFDSFPFYTAYYDDSYVASLCFSKNILGANPEYAFNCALYFGANKVNSTTGYYDVILSPVSSVPYTKDYIPTLLQFGVSQSGNLNLFANGNFSVTYYTQEPTTGNYYYQMMAITGTYQTTVDGQTVYVSKTSFVYLICYRNGYATVPSGLPTDYTPAGNVPLPTATPADGGLNAGTNTVIPITIWLVILIYVIICLFLALLAKTAGLIVGLVISTIICLLAGLIPLWVIIPIILCLIYLILRINNSSPSTGETA